MLRPLPEQKALIYFASVIRLNGTDNQAQLRATINAAIRANVTLNPSTRAAWWRRAAWRRDPAVARRHGDVHRRAGPEPRDELPAISGHALSRWQRTAAARRCSTSTTSSKGIVDAAERARQLLPVGYYSTHTATDGKFRRVKVTLNGDLKAEVSIGRGTSPTSRSPASTRPRKNASSKTR
jgi:hypothetical protein